MQGTAGTTTGSYAEVGLASASTLLLVGTCSGVLEAGGVGRVTCDRYIYVLLPHDGHTLANIVSTVAVYGSTGTVGVSDALNLLEFAGEVVELGLHKGEAVDAADDHGSVLTQTVEDATQGLVSWS